MRKIEENTRQRMRNRRLKKGSVLLLVVISLFVLVLLGSGMLTVAYGVRHKAIRLKNEVVAMLAAEAGYEQAVFWMSQQEDMLNALHNEVSGTNGTLSLEGGECDYHIEFFSFAGSRPIYKVLSNGRSGAFNRTVDVLVVQAISGWDMGLCEVPLGAGSTTPVYFADGEIIDMPLHINDSQDNPDDRDIHIIGDPQFVQPVAMGESRHTDGGSDKYAPVIDAFDGGICFDQPDCRITDTDSIDSKVDRFEENTKTEYIFKPKAQAPVPSPQNAVQLEFFVEDGVGKVCITNDCTVLGYQRNLDYMTLDYKIKPGTSVISKFVRYDIYGYHYMPKGAAEKGQQSTVSIEDTYVTQSFGGVEAKPGGQIFVDGNVIIGGNRTEHDGNQIVNGNITIVATGNIWIADSIMVDGERDADGMPSEDNPNILGLISQGVIKVVDPGISAYDAGGINNYPGPPEKLKSFDYVPVGRIDDPGADVSDGDTEETYDKDLVSRHLPDEMVIEATMTVGGGGWGAENVQRHSYGGRKEASGNQDTLIVRGSITETIRGVVGLVGTDGYLKSYYFDKRVLEGIVPGDIWLRGKYVPAPAGWSDYRSNH